MIEEKQDRIVLCGANSYEQKYYFNEQFSNLPENIRQAEFCLWNLKRMVRWSFR